MNTILQAEGLTKIYGAGETEVKALDAVDLTVPKGQFLSIMGPSGCGKSTLLNLLGGLDVPSSGAVRIAGVSLADLDDDARTLIRRRKLGFVFQFFNLLPTFTASENVALPLLLDGMSNEQGKTIVMVTHDPRYGAMGDRLVRLQDGRITEDGGLSEAAGDEAQAERTP